MTLNIATNLVYAKRISRGTSPKIPSELAIPLDFTADTINVFSLNVLEGIRNNTGIGGIQSVFIDNANNGAVLILSFDSGQTIVCPPFAQAIFPVFFSGEILNFMATSTGGVKVPLIFLNTREQAQLWSTKIPIAGTINVSGSDVFTQPFAGTFTDASQVLAAGGVSQQLLAANGARQLLGIRNPGTPASQGIANPEPVYLNFGAAAAVNGATSLELFPGEQLPQFLMTTIQAINWTAATVGHQLIAKYM